MRRSHKIIPLLLAASGLGRAWGLPTLEPFADATASGGTAYSPGAPLYHQTNALGESWARWNGGTATYLVACTNTGLSYGGFPAGCPPPSPTWPIFDTDAGPGATSALLPGAWGVYSNFANSPYLTQQCR